LQDGREGEDLVIRDGNFTNTRKLSFIYDGVEKAVLFYDNSTPLFQLESNTGMLVLSANNKEWDLTTDGHLIPGSFGAFDIGESGLQKVRNIYTVALTVGTIVFSSSIVAATDNAYDIGSSAANKPRDLYLAGAVKAGTIPLARMQVDEQSGSSTTAWTTVLTDLVTLASMNVVAGDRVDITAYLDCTPASSTTSMQVFIKQSAGTATGEWIVSGGTASTTDKLLWRLRNPDVGTTRQVVTLRTWLRITGTGTLTLRIAAIATGANASASQIDLNALVLRGV